MKLRIALVQSFPSRVTVLKFQRKPLKSNPLAKIYINPQIPLTPMEGPLPGKSQLI